MSVHCQGTTSIVSGRRASIQLALDVQNAQSPSKMSIGSSDGGRGVHGGTVDDR